MIQGINISNLESAQEALEKVKALPLTGRVTIDNLGNTIPADEYRRQQADFLATEIRKIAWTASVRPAAHAIAREADQILKQV